jgi:hypothetical protein
MYKYIIAWVVVSIQSASCPDASKVSEFGTMNRSTMSCAAYHLKTVKETIKKEFYSKDSASYFLKNINQYKPSGVNLFMEDKIENIKIDSIKIK